LYNSFVYNHPFLRSRKKRKKKKERKKHDGKGKKLEATKLRKFLT